MPILYLYTQDVIEIHSRVLQETGGLDGVRTLDGLESALAQARQSFAGEELFPTIHEKAAAIGYYLCQNHCFNDGNKRTAYQSMFVFLYANGYSIETTVDGAEAAILSIATREMKRDELAQWIADRIMPLSQ